jgi:hypothetical protein
VTPPRPAFTLTASQPKSIAVAGDGTVFVAEVNGVEAIRDNQKVFELVAKFSAGSVAVNGSTVAVGGEVTRAFMEVLQQLNVMLGYQSQVIRLGWQIFEGARGFGGQQGCCERSELLA